MRDWHDTSGTLTRIYTGHTGMILVGH